MGRGVPPFGVSVNVFGDACVCGGKVRILGKNARILEANKPRLRVNLFGLPVDDGAGHDRGYVGAG